MVHVNEDMNMHPNQIPTHEHHPYIFYMYKETQ